ncbi:MAG: hypothetical protein IMY84_02095 [Chloroflexi bacterium]|nr:hypothetical protein [Chloroflexota bacterium]
MKKKTLLALSFALVLALSVPMMAAADEEPSVGDLMAGKDTLVGSVQVSNDGWNLYVQYVVDAEGWAMTEAHLAVAPSLGDIPQTKKGNPKVGLFPYCEEFEEPVTEWEVTIPLGDLEAGDRLFIAAHAALIGPEGEDESAWAFGRGFPWRNWATYFVYGVAEPFTLEASRGATAAPAVDPLDETNACVLLSAPAATTEDPEVVLGAEARIVIPLPPGTTLSDIESISWMEYLKTGYPPHVDVIVDTGGSEDALVFEYAYNDVALHYPEGWPSYNALTDAWYATFSDDGDGPVEVGGSTLGWLASGPPGPPTEANFATLSDWQSAAGVTYGAVTVNGDTPVLRIEIEVDNWLGGAEAFVDDMVVVLAS